MATIKLEIPNVNVSQLKMPQFPKEITSLYVTDAFGQTIIIFVKDEWIKEIKE